VFLSHVERAIGLTVVFPVLSAVSHVEKETSGAFRADQAWIVPDDGLIANGCVGSCR